MAVDPKENVTRQNIPQDPRNPKDHLDSGYESQPSLDFTIPPVGIEDIDFALHRLFDTLICFLQALHNLMHHYNQQVYNSEILVNKV